VDKKEFLQLIDRYLAGKATLDEEQLLLNFFDSFQHDMQWSEEVLGAKQALEDKMLKRLHDAIAFKPVARYKHKTIGSLKYALATMVILLLAGDLVFYKFSDKPVKQQLAAIHKPAVKHDVDPGTNQAILTLSNGTKLVLNRVKNGILLKSGHISIKKAKDGQLIYTVEKEKRKDNSPLITYNTVSTPNGGQYQVILPDGTKVWLDAASSLKFPTAFAGNERTVELSGEAYFEVTKNAAMPFNVKVNNMRVRVLGTHFNIMAYANEANIKTTLLEGSVQLTSGNKSNVLKPGQQGVVAKDGQIEVRNVDTEQAIAWKNGFFEFDRSNIQEIMNQLSRWYDTNVAYEGKVPDDEFVGKIERGAKLSQVLHILELSNVHFRIEDKKIIVTP
jgi:transmembrane sensor